jgi:septal ring factor EnvC (AmiA/AmiB activator)
MWHDLTPRGPFGHSRAYIARLFACLVFAAPSLMAGPVRASDGDSADTARSLQEIEKQLEASKQAVAGYEGTEKETAAALDKLRDRMTSLAGDMQQREARQQQLEAQANELEDKEDATLADLERDRGTLGELLAALQRFSLYPPQAALLRGDDPVAAVRGGMLIASAMPGIRERADALSARLRELHQLRSDLEDRRAQLADVRGDLAAKRAELEALIAERTQLLETTRVARAAESARATRLAARARDMRDLIARLEEERKQREAQEAAAAAAAAAAAEAQRQQQAALAVPIAPAPQQPDAAPGGGSGRGKETRLRGGLIKPVAGPILTAYGDDDDTGEPLHGIRFAVTPGATVVAPAAGRVAYAGPFRGFGQILILEHSGGYHSLMAGFGRIDAVVGQRVEAGEPVGTVEGRGDTSSPTFYFELRQGGDPIDPAEGIRGRG